MFFQTNKRQNFLEGLKITNEIIGLCIFITAIIFVYSLQQSLILCIRNDNTFRSFSIIIEYAALCKVLNLLFENVLYIRLL